MISLKTLGLITHLLTAFILFMSFCLQRKHNKLSVKPILQVGQWDYENKLIITLTNCGTGPALIDNIEVFKNDYEKATCIYDWLPKELPGQMNYQEYYTGYKNFALQASSVLKLLQLPVNDEVEEERKTREEIRGILRQLTVRINYKSIYNQKMPLIEKRLEVFNRQDNEN